MYDGVPCAVTADACCYNIERWCPEFNVTGQCERFDRGAYPVGDQRIFSDQMSNFRALTPFPNAIFWNWATIFILGFGNLAALDFQARCMASKTPRTARIGCIIGGLFTFLIGIPFAYMGAISRYVARVVLCPSGTRTLVLAAGRRRTVPHHVCLTPYLFYCCVPLRTECTTVRIPSTPNSRWTRVSVSWPCPPVASGSPTRTPLSSC